MSLNFEEVKQIDQRTKNIVFGFIRWSQQLLLQESTYYNIPNIIYHICILFFWQKIIPYKFSEKYKSNHGIITLSDDKIILNKPYKNIDKYPYIALDHSPIKDGIHCFRIKVKIIICVYIYI